MKSSSKWFTYENGLLFLLAFTFGLIFFDRNALGVLSTYIVDELSLNNEQLGLLNSGLALAWALSAYILSAWSDKISARKPFLLISIVVFSLCSASSGLAASFMFLLLARVFMGISEGPFLPISLAVMNVESSPHRRGLNAGIMQNVFAALLGTTLAPILLVVLAEAFSWRVAFFLTGIPGLICAFLLWKFMREPESGSQEASAGHSITWGALRMLGQHNIRLCALISIFMVAWFLISLAFLPIFLTNYKGLSPEQMSYVMAPMGVCTVLGGFLVPWFSDRVGRKPVMIIFCFLSMLTPITALYFDGPLWLMATLLFIGWTGSTTFALFMGVIPGETVSRAQAASAMGLVVCIGELVGGAGGPWAAGWVADHSSLGLVAPMAALALCAFLSGVTSLFLKETAPGVVNAENPAPAV